MPTNTMSVMLAGNCATSKGQASAGVNALNVLPLARKVFKRGQFSARTLSTLVCCMSIFFKNGIAGRLREVRTPVV